MVNTKQKMKTNYITLFFFFILFASAAYAQRAEINEGVEQYYSEKYADAEVNFKKGKEKAPDKFEAHFNLGDAYYKQQRYEESIKEFYSSLELTDDQELKARAYHNIGNSLLKSEKYKESIDAYKNALKINPGDQETKYNISYALQQMEKQQNQQQNQNQDQNKENEDQKKEQNQQDNKNDQQQNDQNNPEQQNEETPQDNTQTQQQPKDQISQEEAERILQALKNNEQDIQKKIRKKTGTVIKKEKDW